MLLHPAWGSARRLGVAETVMIALLLSVLGGLPVSSDPVLQMSLTEAAPETVGRYQKYEATFRLSDSYQNPFDADEVGVRGVFVAPSGREVTMPAFIYDRDEQLWKVRFAPRELGGYQARIVARAGGSRRELALPPFEVAESDSRGFVRVTAEKPGRLEFETGGMFLPVSIVLWGRYLSDLKDELSELREAGINHFRFLMDEKNARGAYAFEHAGLPVGEYDLERARNLDELFDRLESLDMYITLNLIEHAEFRVNEPYTWFGDNPYNVKNGGPCEKPSDFFVHPEARKLFKRRLRYIVSRWGYSPRLAMVQFWAEVDFSDGYADDPAAVRAWHQEMADYLHAIDPYRHLASTSLTLRGVSTAYERAGLFDIPSMDVASTELYNERDMAEAIRQDAVYILNRYQKPQALAECGLTHEMFSDDRDTEGLHMHAALWASVMSGSSTTPSFWWWQKILDYKLLPHFTAVARYLEGEDFIGLPPIEAESITYTAPPTEVICGDLSAPMPVEETAWGPPTDDALKDERGRFVVQIPNDGRPLGVQVPRTLPPNRPIVFAVDYAEDGEFVLGGWWLPDTGTAKVRARLDDAEVLHIDLPGVGWEGRFTVYRDYLGVPWSFPVPKGRHRIVVENVGDAWMTMSVDLCNYLRPDKPNLRAFGLGDPTRAYLWVTNRDNTWWRNRMGKAPRPVSGAVVTLRDMRPGAYEVEWWDTYAGCVSGRTEAVADSSGSLSLSLPTVARDVACKIRPKAGPAGSTG